MQVASYIEQRRYYLKRAQVLSLTQLSALENAVCVLVAIHTQTEIYAVTWIRLGMMR